MNFVDTNKMITLNVNKDLVKMVFE